MGQSWSRAFGVEADGALYPANFAFTLAGKQMCSSSFAELGPELKGAGKVLVIASGENRLKMANGTIFSTGHNPTEFFVPLHHLLKAGYTLDICSPAAKPVTIEHWAMPACALGGYSAQVLSTQAALQPQLQQPLDVAAVSPTLEGYVGVFIPGGHGPMINMHGVREIGALLLAAHAKGLPTASLCHGPNALRAAALAAADGEFPYKGYSMCCFPDKADTTLWLRYLPGLMVQKCEAELKALGARIVNSAMDDSVVLHRELVTGASQRAAQKLAVQFLQLLKNGPGAAGAAK